ncbi:MAG: YkgJ family cysteine cluster protein [Pirellulaceae bacterium]|jgi:Fe-S-cluster containining protein|nr:YkgJ family cysteine cluster protein [Pirellulaceae bacterium]
MNEQDMAQRWYQEGLRFECTQCGGCCSGDPGVVWVNAEEVTALAESMQLDEEAFRRKFVRKVGTRFSLVEYPDGDCIFLDPKTRGCLVYSARPVQCRTWPFWSSNVKSPQAWEETCKVCPGAGNGKLYSIEQIESARQQKRV